MIRIIAASLLALCLAGTLTAADRVTGRAFATRSDVAAQHGMACTSQPLVTQVALDILKAGGSAVDAAIAADAALGLMEPTGAGMGGDLYALVWSAKDRKSMAATPGWSGTPTTVTLASLTSWVTALTIACSISGSSSTTQVPSVSVNVDRT